MEYLSIHLTLTEDQILFLNSNSSEITGIYNYLALNYSEVSKNILINHINRLMADLPYFDFVLNHSSSGSPIAAWWMDDNFLLPQGGVSFGTWAINYLALNPTIPFRTFQNWFFNLPDYTGGEDVIDPSLTTYDDPVIQTPLPSLANFTTYFPKLGSSGSYSQMPSSQVYQLVGGSLYQSHIEYPAQYTNACAVRGSRALLYSGINIPVIRNGTSQRTQKGGDNKNYILDAVSFNKFMIDKFGDTPNKLEGADANNPQKVADLLKGKNGIYVIINNNSGPAPNGPGYSGHVDLILNGACLGAAYTTPIGGVKSIRIWVLN